MPVPAFTTKLPPTLEVPNTMAFTSVSDVFPPEVEATAPVKSLAASFRVMVVLALSVVVPGTISVPLWAIRPVPEVATKLPVMVVAGRVRSALSKMRVRFRMVPAIVKVG